MVLHRLLAAGLVLALLQAPAILAQDGQDTGPPATDVFVEECDPTNLAVCVQSNVLIVPNCILTEESVECTPHLRATAVHVGRAPSEARAHGLIGYELCDETGLCQTAERAFDTECVTPTLSFPSCDASNGASFDLDPIALAPGQCLTFTTWGHAITETHEVQDLTDPWMLKAEATLEDHVDHLCG